jgi:uncharacterized cupin superfamily protein
MPRIRLPVPVYDTDPTHPVLEAKLGPYRYQLLSNVGGLSQFGAFIEELAPGSASSHRHWHENEDEMVYMLEGTAILIEDTETELNPGYVACWPAGSPVGHRLENRSDAVVRHLVIGTRHTQDVIHYSDHDLITHKDGNRRRYMRRNGTDYPDRSPT